MKVFGDRPETTGGWVKAQQVGGKLLQNAANGSGKLGGLSISERVIQSLIR